MKRLAVFSNFRSTRPALLAAAAAFLVGCSTATPLPQPTPKPASFAAFLQNVPSPPDNPTTQAKVELGFRLWFEPRLSANDRMTCATCHHHRKGFSDAEITPAGVNGQRGSRNTPTIYGAAHQPFQFWDGRAKTLEEQALGPITNPIEMAARMEDVLAKLEAMPYYRLKFQEVFQSPPTADAIGKALAAFERALVVGPSPYDRYLAGEKSALTPQQERGMRLFNSRKTSCTLCHNGKTLSNGQFFNTGVSALSAKPDLGRFNVTGAARDREAFKTPTLLNIAQTAPYMHDGSLPTLEAVIDFYNRGGGPSPTRHPAIRPLGLTEAEKADLLAFLHALTGPDNLKELAKLPGIRHRKHPTEALDVPPDLLP